LLLIGAVPADGVADVAIVPQPREIVRAAGEFRLRPGASLLFESGATELQAARPYLAATLARFCPGLTVGDAPSPREGAIFSGRLPGAPAADYTLDVSPGRVELRAGGAAGLIHGLATLRQLLPTAAEAPGAAPPDSGWALPAVRVADGPRFPWRGVLLDCCRHFMPVPLIEDLLDLMALYKLDRLHWHLTEDQAWRLEIRSRPRLTEVGAWRTEADGTRHGGFYTQAEARHVVAYAAARGIAVMPEIELPGHCRAALAAYPELSCRGEALPVPAHWGVFADVYCAGNEAVFAFLDEVIAEVVAIFPAAELHIGGDEVPRDRWRECPRCQARLASEGLTDLDALQAWFVRRVAGRLAERGRRVVGWDEILAGGPLPPGAIVQSWRGFDGAVAAARAGHEVVVSPTSHCYLDYDVAVTDLARCYAFEPVPSGLAPDEARRVLGGEMNLWTEFVPPEAVPGRLLPRLLALSEALWSPASSGTSRV